MRVAVLGAGFQGTCIALELDSRGVEVDLYDQDEQPITRSGFVNEGRIHLGFNYSNDPSLRTASLMTKGALSFRRSLNRGSISTQRLRTAPGLWFTRFIATPWFRLSEFGRTSGR